MELTVRIHCHGNSYDTLNPTDPFSVDDLLPNLDNNIIFSDGGDSNNHTALNPIDPFFVGGLLQNFDDDEFTDGGGFDKTGDFGN